MSLRGALFATKQSPIKWRNLLDEGFLFDGRLLRKVRSQRHLKSSIQNRKS